MRYVYSGSLGARWFLPVPREVCTGTEGLYGTKIMSMQFVPLKRTKFEGQKPRQASFSWTLNSLAINLGSRYWPHNRLNRTSSSTCWRVSGALSQAWASPDTVSQGIPKTRPQAVLVLCYEKVWKILTKTKKIKGGKIPCRLSWNFGQSRIYRGTVNRVPLHIINIRK